MTNKKCILTEESIFLHHEGVLRQLPQFKRDLNNRLAHNICTPDLPYIESKRGHLLFVYGTLKQGFSRNWMLKGYKARFVASAISTLEYSLFYSPALGFPVMMPRYCQSEVGHVMGQLWIIPPKLIAILDDVEKNGDMYNRIKINVQLITKPTDTQFQQYATTYAFGYIGNPKEWGQQIIQNKMLPIMPSENKIINFIQPRILTP